jgi:hypothetical protein
MSSLCEKFYQNPKQDPTTGLKLNGNSNKFKQLSRACGSPPPQKSSTLSQKSSQLPRKSSPLSQKSSKSLFSFKNQNKKTLPLVPVVSNKDIIKPISPKIIKSLDDSSKEDNDYCSNNDNYIVRGSNNFYIHNKIDRKCSQIMKLSDCVARAKELGDDELVRFFAYQVPGTIDDWLYRFNIVYNTYYGDSNINDEFVKLGDSLNSIQNKIYNDKPLSDDVYFYINDLYYNLVDDNIKLKHKY